MTIRDLEQEYRNVSPDDRLVLLSSLLGIPKTTILAYPERHISKTDLPMIRIAFERRLKREPIAFIIGKKEFYGLTFKITKDTLIPRPETELLVELAIDDIKSRIVNQGLQRKNTLVADIGTGSGNIIISLASTLKQFDATFKIRNLKFEIHATDISHAALAIAQENAKTHSVDDLIVFHEGNLLEPIKKYFDEADELIIVGNLPYLSHSLYESASEDVRNYEPRLALESGEDGLDHYRELFVQLKGANQQSKSVSMFCEISPEQAELIEGFAAKIFPEAEIGSVNDLSGRKRAFFFRLKKPY